MRKICFSPTASRQRAIERHGRCQVVPERLLDYQTAPPLVILLRKSRVAKLLGDEREERRAGREIKQAVPAGPFLFLDLAELFSESARKAAGR